MNAEGFSVYPRRSLVFWPAAQRPETGGCAEDGTEGHGRILIKIRKQSMIAFTTLPSHIKSKISMLWIKQKSSLYSPVSNNILREACQLIAFARPRLVACKETELIAFDPIKHQRQSICYLGAEIRLNYVIPGECVAISDYQIFMCGGRTKRVGLKEVAENGTFIVEQENAVMQREMIRGRYLHGLYYHDKSLCVFAFGGYVDYQRVGGRCSQLESGSCEQFDLRSSSWSRLPELISAHTGMNPCGYKDKVFLCGRFNNNVQVFNVATKKFQNTSVIVRPIHPMSIALTWNDQLIVIRGIEICKWDCNTYASIENLKHDCEEIASKESLLLKV